jgi:hypothetical protein
VIAPIFALAPRPEIAVILPLAGLGALAGTAVAAHRRLRDPKVDAGLVTAQWTLVGGVVGVTVVAAHWLGLW